ncbi:hypothetical protein [Pseudooceanicola aestuarii]|uniref:hypothetical protein n=1 Tax=Pseudooceanicola aestuarii TaxID=2697319 RepID=UPI0013D67099|nr:hypothetical protein [Pseudooceanicola aestuarii]
MAAALPVFAVRAVPGRHVHPIPACEAAWRPVKTDKIELNPFSRGSTICSGLSRRPSQFAVKILQTQSEKFANFRLTELFTAAPIPPLAVDIEKRFSFMGFARHAQAKHPQGDLLRRGRALRM